MFEWCAILTAWIPKRIPLPCRWLWTWTWWMAISQLALPKHTERGWKTKNKPAQWTGIRNRAIHWDALVEICVPFVVDNATFSDEWEEKKNQRNVIKSNNNTQNKCRPQYLLCDIQANCILCGNATCYDCLFNIDMYNTCRVCDDRLVQAESLISMGVNWLNIICFRIALFFCFFFRSGRPIVVRSYHRFSIFRLILGARQSF